MRLLKLLGRYWFYLLVWVAGVWLLWLVTPVWPILANTVPDNKFVVEFLHQGREFFTVGYTKPIPNQSAVLFHGPVLIKDTETGEVKRSLFSREDRFVNLFVEQYQDHLIRSVRKQGVRADGRSDYLLEWIDTDTGAVLASCHPDIDAHAPENHAAKILAALSPDRRYAVYYASSGNKRQTVCVELSTGKQIFTKDNAAVEMVFSPDGKYLRYARAGGFVVLEMPSGQEILEIPSKGDESWLTSSWSPDGKLLYTSDGAIWNVETRKRQTYLPDKPHMWPSEGMVGRPHSFTSDSREVISTMADGDGIWLVYYDVDTGKENESKHLLVLPGLADGPHVYVDGYRGRYILICAYSLYWNQSWSGKIQGTLHYLQGYFHGSRTNLHQFTGYVVVDTLTNNIIMTGRGNTLSGFLSPDGQYLFVYPDRPGPWDLECWHVPPRKALSAFGYVAVGWLLGCLTIRAFFYGLGLRRRKPVNV